MARLFDSVGVFVEPGKLVMVLPWPGERERATLGRYGRGVHSTDKGREN